MTSSTTPEKGRHRARLGDRALFPDLTARAYLAHAAIAPPSLPVREAVREHLDDYARGPMDAFPRGLARRARLKERLGELISASARDIAFVPNTTAGVIAIAQCFPWKAGDRVILFEGEFPANVTPWQRAAKMHDLEVVFVDVAPFLRSPEEGLAALEDVLREGARLCAVSAVQFQTGLRMPLEGIASLCRRHGAELFVDAIQALGVVPVDVGVGIDYLSCGGHKWLLGVEGAGFLYVPEERAAHLRPHLAGWTSHEGGLRFLTEGAGHLRYDRRIRPQADFLEVGALSTAGYAALAASVDLLLELGIEAIFEHVSTYLDRLEGGMVARGFRSVRSAEPEGRSGILSFVPPDPEEALALPRRLAGHGVVATLPDGLLRFAPHFANSLDEVDHVLRAVDDAVAGR